MPIHPSGSLREAQTNRKLVITLSLNDECQPTVRAVEVIAPNYRNQTTFPTGRVLSDVFSKNFLRTIDVCTRGIKSEESILSLPNLVIEASGLVLKGAHILVRRMRLDSTIAIIRFDHFLGDVVNILNDDIDFGEGLRSEKDYISSLALCDLVRPILDVCQAIQCNLIEASNPMITAKLNITDLARDLGFYNQLLIRYISQSQMKEAMPRNEFELPFREENSLEASRELRRVV